MNMENNMTCTKSAFLGREFDEVQMDQWSTDTSESAVVGGHGYKDDKMQVMRNR